MSLNHTTKILNGSYFSENKSLKFEKTDCNKKIVVTIYDKTPKFENWQYLK